MKAEDHTFDGRPQVDHLRTTTTDDLQSWCFALRAPMEVIDGNGEILTLPEGAQLLVVDLGSLDRPLAERSLDRAELAVHHTYGMRPARTETRTPFDIRTPHHGGRQDDDVPF